MRRAWALSILVAPAACQVDPVTETTLDPDFFRCSVQPMFDTRCSMLACHGDEQRPLRIFTRNRLRLDADTVQLNLPISEDELAANYDNALALATEPPEDSLLVRKPLDESAGGYYHDGRELYLMDDVFLNTDDLGYHLLLDWMNGQAEDPSCTYAGSEAPAGTAPGQETDG